MLLLFCFPDCNDGHFVGYFVAACEQRVKACAATFTAFPYTCNFSCASLLLAILDEVTDKVNDKDDPEMSEEPEAPSL